jgi:PAS domain S-box-containing protein
MNEHVAGETATLGPGSTSGSFKSDRPAADQEPMLRFKIAAGASAIAVVLFVLWTAFEVGGPKFTIAVDDYGEAAAALVATFSCGLAATRVSGRWRGVWGLLAASAACWGVGEVTWAIQEVNMGIAVPFPSPADAGYLAALPLAIAAVLSLPTAPNRATTRGRAVLDGTTLALSLLFVGWVLGLDRLYVASPLSPFEQGIAVAYPLGDIVIIAVLLLAIRRAGGPQRGKMLLLLGGLAANAVADSAFAYLTATGSYAAIGSQFDTGWVIGYLAIALSPLWPEVQTRLPTEEGSIPLWQLAVPWLALVGAAIAAFGLTANGKGLDVFLTRLIAAIALLLVASDLVAHKDAIGLLDGSRRAEAASRRSEAELRERTALLNQVIAQAPMGIARASTELVLVDANPGLAQLLHEPLEGIIGSPVGKYLSSDDGPRVLDQFGALVSGSIATIETESLLNLVDGSRTWCHCNATLIWDAAGVPEYILAMLTDVTPHHQAQDAALANLAHLERLSRLKSEFMSSVSHEFRTALTGIQGFSELMRDQVVTPDDVKEMAGDINSDAERLSRMITEMLDLDRIESGRFTLHLEGLDLNKLIEDSIVRARVSTSKHSIETDLESDLPQVIGDSDRLIQVMSNLLNNAVKYSPEGGAIIVTTRVELGNVRVSIRDHGQGIPAEFIDRLFGRYERFEGSAAKTVGTGLGLAIVRQIIELHHGRIWVTSEVGAGSEFSFTIPVQSATQPGTPQA